MNKIPVVTDRELDILEVIWNAGQIPAQDISAYFLEAEHGGYSKNTTYTFLKRLVKKGVIKREEPGYICIPNYTRSEIQAESSQTFLNRVYQGSLRKMFTQFVEEKQITDDELRELKALIDEQLKKEKP